MNLYTASLEWQSIEAELEETGGELTPELHERMANAADTIESLIESAAFKCIEDKAEGEGIASEIERLSKIKKAHDKRIESRKALMKYIMELRGVEKIKRPLLTVSILKSKAVMVDEGAELPDEYIRVVPEKREPDKTAIKKALEEGVELEGCEFTYNKSLQIR